MPGICAGRGISALPSIRSHRPVRNKSRRSPITYAFKLSIPALLREPHTQIAPASRSPPQPDRNSGTFEITMSAAGVNVPAGTTVADEITVSASRTFSKLPHDTVGFTAGNAEPAEQRSSNTPETTSHRRRSPKSISTDSPSRASQQNFTSPHPKPRRIITCKASGVR